ncbi:hypothetical protein EYF80_039096 [Liparis tanakae]|uniref:Uncharacterized protein n=1 Tax=Liparis tanakae TaxID=230148 RepID=A0A4Z2GAT1_9TELE|nr:hypothetical protein EYF80_039096 [Liparis tanakae]
MTTNPEIGCTLETTSRATAGSGPASQGGSMWGLCGVNMRVIYSPLFCPPCLVASDVLLLLSR